MRCLSVLDLVILFHFFNFFPWPQSSKRSANGEFNSLKTSILPLPTPLRGCRSLLEIVFCRRV